MNRITIFYGSNKEFIKTIPESYRSLTDIITELDNKNRKVSVYPYNSFDDYDEPLEITNFVIHSEEYSSVKEHVIINFVNFISQLDVKNLYIQNPPLHISEQLHRVYDSQNILEEIHQSYEKVTKAIIRKFYSEYDSKVIGQENAKMDFLQALYPLINNKQKKPVVILLYGDSGIGKTETALYLAELLNGELMRKQFSMYHNNQFATYLFGGSHGENSFAKDLLDRNSNVILLDEFDKADPIFHSAFYQLFDEGIYEDQNYKVSLDYAVIICTSNYKTESEIKECLGAPIFNRFDATICFEMRPTKLLQVNFCLLNLNN